MSPEQLEACIAQAVAYARDTYDPLGVVVGGSLVRGEGGPHSDLDVVIVHRCPWRLRDQRRFGGVPAELFVNPPHALRGYFVTERAEGRPVMAHLLAHGRVMPGAEAEVLALVDEARASWEAGPPPFDRAAAVHGAVDLLDDARDLHGRDDAGELALLAAATQRIAEVAERAAGRWAPRRKAALATLARRDPDCARLVGAFAAAPPEARLELVAELARHVLGVDGFFSWRSAPEPRDP